MSAAASGAMSVAMSTWAVSMTAFSLDGAATCEPDPDPAAPDPGSEGPTAAPCMLPTDTAGPLPVLGAGDLLTGPPGDMRRASELKVASYKRRCRAETAAVPGRRQVSLYCQPPVLLLAPTGTSHMTAQLGTILQYNGQSGRHSV